MTISAGNAIPTFDNPVTETKDGTTYIQNFRVPLNGFATANAQQRALAQTIALNAPGLPQYGHQFAGNSNAFCEKRSSTVISGQENNVPTQVIVTCTFSTIPVDKADEEMNPLDKRPDITWSTTFEREVITNANGLEILQNNGMLAEIMGQGEANIFNEVNQGNLGIKNSANEPFNPQPEKDIPYPVVTVTQNVPRGAWNSTTNASMIGTVNSNAFSVDGVNIPKRQALLLDRTARTMYQGKLSYREVTTSLLLKATHKLIVQDRGFKIIVIKETPDPDDPPVPSEVYGGGGGMVIQTVAKIDGEDTPVEVLLDGKGNILPLGDKAVYLHFQIFNETNFDQLGLPRAKQ